MSSPAAFGPTLAPSGLGWIIPGVGSPTWAGTAGEWLPRMIAEAIHCGVSVVHLGSDPSTIGRLPVVLKSLGSAGKPVDLVLVFGPVFGSTGQDVTHPRLPAPDQPLPVRLHVELPLGLLREPEGRLWAEELEGARTKGRIRSWGVGMETLDRTGRKTVRQQAPGAAWVRGPFHLLSPHEAVRTVEDLVTDGLSIVASDPFASGRLDGSVLAATYLDRPPGAVAREVERLKREWAPVLQLGFLARPGRTLPAAALAEVRDRPGIRAVLVEAYDAADLQRATTLWAAPGLTDPERARIEALRL